jgi:hypothetical protein
MARIIKVPKTPRSAYDPARKTSALLKAHISNLEAVTRGRRGVKSSSRPRTERQASAYIAKLTALLQTDHDGSADPVAAAPPVSIVPIVVVAATPKTRRKRRPARKSAPTKRTRAKTRTAGRRRKTTRAGRAKK